jgi:hypothetical protein
LASVAAGRAAPVGGDPYLWEAALMARISRTWLATAGALLSIPIVVLLLLFPARSSAQAPETLTVYATFAKVKYVDAARGSSDVGDYTIWRLHLRDEGGSILGTEVDDCLWVHLERQLCNSAFNIQGRGRLVAEGIWDPHPGTVSVFAVTGGTGDFMGARGTAQFEDGGDGRVKVTFTLM